ncbi:hypothetical protein ES703_39674 [subsurface metagenome]
MIKVGIPSGEQLQERIIKTKSLMNNERRANKNNNCSRRCLNGY